MNKLLIWFLILILSNCATVTGPGKQFVVITSEPSKSEVTVDGRIVTTPAVIELKGKSEYYITATKAGYRTTPQKIDSQVRVMASVVGNILNFTGLIGMGVDFFGTGAAYKMDKNINIVMLPDNNKPHNSTK